MLARVSGIPSKSSNHFLISVRNLSQCMFMEGIHPMPVFTDLGCFTWTTWTDSRRANAGAGFRRPSAIQSPSK